MTDPHWDAEASVQGRGAPTADTPSVRARELSHAEVRARLSDYLDGSLVPDERARVEAHLDECRDCRAFRDTLRQTVHALDSLPRLRAPADAKRRLLERVRERAASPRRA